MENNELRSKLGSKLAEISKMIGKMKLDGNNTHSNYKFISYEAVSGELRNAMSKVGITIIPAVESFEEHNFTNNKGTQFVRTIVKMSFNIIDNETGYTEKTCWYGADQDSGGKSLAQAITECQKRFQMKLFNISSKGDVDPDTKTTEIQHHTIAECKAAARKNLGANWTTKLLSEIENLFGHRDGAKLKGFELDKLFNYLSSFENDPVINSKNNYIDELGDI